MLNKYKLTLNKVKIQLLKDIFWSNFYTAIFFTLNIAAFAVLVSNIFKIFDLKCLIYIAIASVIFLTTFIAVTTVKAKRKITLEFIAQKFDKEIGCKNQVATGWELVNGNYYSFFTSHVIEQGHRILQENSSYIPAENQPAWNKRWYLCFGLILCAVVTAFFNSPPLSSPQAQNILLRNQAGHSGAVSDETGKNKTNAAAINKNYPKTKADILNNRIQSKNNQQSKKTQGKVSSVSSESKTNASSSESNNSSASSDKKNKEKNTRNSKVAQKYKSRKTEGSKGAQGNGLHGLESSSEKSLSMSQRGLSGNDMLDHQRLPKDKKNKKKRKKSKGGKSLLSLDQKYDKGKGKEDNSPKEKRANDGRSDSAGDKKTRGTASRLSAVPQPDLINGALSPGKSLSHSKKSIPGKQLLRNNTPVFKGKKMPENTTYKEKINPALKQTIKNFIVETHNLTDKDKNE